MILCQVFLTVESMNIITGSHEQSHHFWNERLLPSVRSRFGELAVDQAEEGNIRLLLQPCVMYIIQRLQVCATEVGVGKFKFACVEAKTPLIDTNRSYCMASVIAM